MRSSGQQIIFINFINSIPLRGLRRRYLSVSRTRRPSRDFDGATSMWCHRSAQTDGMYCMQGVYRYLIISFTGHVLCKAHLLLCVYLCLPTKRYYLGRLRFSMILKLFLDWYFFLLTSIIINALRYFHIIKKMYLQLELTFFQSKWSTLMKHAYISFTFHTVIFKFIGTSHYRLLKEVYSDF